ncbi:hypothetical protein D3Y59_16605 [Hymenobacter oligotrophus]|uniref:Uncharacterized protein n=1 Tax=Hymenobacter oligotrophus TaxID=2319843 RepID=A0A3B7R3D9_9BACT|nr:hypothetical protein [Hymenobacter oligotrophus]AYA38525.1 hypothetical protein D3Y59_16605 [Hymenobacter oligotrophus]
MRHVADIPHPDMKLTLLAWNGKYLLKCEQGSLEQTYKVSEMDLLGADADLPKLLDDTFVAAVLRRFADMRADFAAALERQDLV